MTEKGKYYRCGSCGRTYRCRVGGKPASTCSHPLDAQEEITQSEYAQIRKKSCYRNQERMERQTLQARKSAEVYGIDVTDKDDAVSIFGKDVGLSRREVIRIFAHIGWILFDKRGKKVMAKARAGVISREDAENTPPEADDLDLFYEMETLVAFARGIPRDFRMETHPRFEEYAHFFSLAIRQFAYCYPYHDYCSQEGLCWLFDGLEGILEHLKQEASVSPKERADEAKQKVKDLLERMRKEREKGYDILDEIRRFVDEGGQH